MPSSRKNCSCIICGTPSDTVVCMRCFFNYDYRTYNNRELEKRKMKNHRESEFEEYRESTHWNPENEMDPDLAYDTPNEIPTPKPELFSPRTWLAKISRYS